EPRQPAPAWGALESGLRAVPPGADWGEGQRRAAGRGLNPVTATPVTATRMSARVRQTYVRKDRHGRKSDEPATVDARGRGGGPRGIGRPGAPRPGRCAAGLASGPRGSQ